MTCYACKKEVMGRVVWLMEDYRSEGGQIEGPHSMHVHCANQPWPLYEVSEEEARRILQEPKS